MKRVFSIVILMCFLTGCAFNPMVSVYDNNKKIASEMNSYNLNEVEQTLEKGHFVASVEKMEGMDTIWVLEAEEDKTLDITYSLNVSSGTMKIVVISPNGEVKVIAECDNEMNEPIQSTLNVEKGNNRIKIVAGKNTKFDIDISISEGEFNNVG